MSGDHIAQPATQPGTNDDPAVSSPPGTDQPEALPGDLPPGDRLISIREIRQLFSLGRTAAYELTHRPGFPAPVPLSSHAYRWWASEVAAFAAALRIEGQNPPGRSRRRAQQPTLPQETAHLRITGKVRSARSRKAPR
jgi:predicted DNA-binding transcriptional regulator AlpA